MRHHDVVITDADQGRLRRLAGRLRRTDPEQRDRIVAVERHARGAQIVSPKDVPRNVVTLNSRVAVKDLDSRKRFVCSLVDPADLVGGRNRVSVAAPCGIALLGKPVGQIVRWTDGTKIRRLRILQIFYQPEAAGDFHL